MMDLLFRVLDDDSSVACAAYGDGSATRIRRAGRFADSSASPLRRLGLPGSLDAEYLNAGAVKAGNVILVTFPMKTRILTTNIEGIECRVTLKGNTLIGIEPATDYPLENHVKNRLEEAPMIQIDRFVSRERFML